ncbi:MAG: hypothetical protein RBG13Loki_4118 [Promethearchaeota archaeon CR_4]|nr:MAG: hypothetical protein RBG13Loki_4118 [Candidatus Lokiarchaeota archaeon CR_4]
MDTWIYKSLHNENIQFKIRLLSKMLISTNTENKIIFSFLSKCCFKKKSSLGLEFLKIIYIDKSKY